MRPTGKYCVTDIYAQTTKWRSRGIKRMRWVSYLFYGLNDKTGPVTCLAPSTDEEIEERISTTTRAYTTESNEDTFKPDVVFESFHHQARVPIFDRALLVGFLMIWLKRCVVPILTHEVIIADVVYQQFCWHITGLLPFSQQWWAAFKVGCECS